MRFIILLFFTRFFFGRCYDVQSTHVRTKRDAVGALHIVTNHAQPIHEDVKPEAETITEKPCPDAPPPSNIEMGTVFQVVPPKEVWVEGQSLRKSLPLTTKLDLVRNVSRIITLFVLILSGIFEFYPMLQHLYNTIYGFIYV